MLKSTFFQGMAVLLIDAKGPTVLGGSAVDVTPDGSPMGSNLD